MKTSQFNVRLSHLFACLRSGQLHRGLSQVRMESLQPPPQRVAPSLRTNHSRMRRIASLHYLLKGLELLNQN